jgi:hypothetical protein
MSLSEDQADCYCRKPFRIVHVKFRLSGTAIIACCPNCAMVSADILPAAESQIIDKAQKLAITTRAFWQKVATPMMESTSYKFRYVLALLAGALATAASPRHLIHTYGGLRRETRAVNAGTTGSGMGDARLLARENVVGLIRDAGS